MSAGGIGKTDLVAGDQRPSKQELAEQVDAKTPGNAHQANDAKDERSIANRLDKAKPQNDDGDSDDKPLPTEIARSHGNEPSKGAKIDQLQLEEEAELRKKGKLP